jgi:hypothetical protein
MNRSRKKENAQIIKEKCENENVHAEKKEKMLKLCSFQVSMFCNINPTFSRRQKNLVIKVSEIGKNGQHRNARPTPPPHLSQKTSLFQHVYNLKDGSKSAVFRQSILVVPP